MIYELLVRYLRINTSQGDVESYTQAVDLLSRYALEDGFSTRTVWLPSGYPLLIITLEGRSPHLSSLVLNHHMDVVPAYREDGWICDPFEGYNEGNLITARGTQDMKGVGIVHYGALQKLKKENIQPERTIHLIAVPDEERGGFKGTKEFIEHPLFKDLRIGYVLDEGMPSGNDKEILVKVAERTPLQIRVTSKGSTAHGSQLLAHNCTRELIAFLYELSLLHNAQQKEALVVPLGLLTSYQVTSLEAGFKNVFNMIPAQAYATVDIRVPPHLSFEGVYHILDSLCSRYSVSYTVLATSKERMPIASLRSHFYTSLVESIHEAGYTAKPLYFEATTDTRFYTNKGIEGLGMTPFTVEANLHGVNESIRIRDVEEGIKILYNFLTFFAVNKN